MKENVEILLEAGKVFLNATFCQIDNMKTTEEMIKNVSDEIKKKILPFVRTLLEGIMLNEINRKRQILCNLFYMWSKV